MEHWVIMFVDMVNSTRLKYTQESAIVIEVIKKLYSIIQDKSSGKESIKFTGDGAMVIFKQKNNGCEMALKAAEGILQAVDRQNLLFDPQFKTNLYPISIRIGISTGECHEISTIGLDLCGRKVDLAARLCAEAEPDSILIDEATKGKSNFPKHRFSFCKRRLLLKGVPIPPGSPEKYFYFNPKRFLKSQLYYSNGLLSLYPDRNSLMIDFRPARIIHIAAPNSVIFVAGRTLISWTSIIPEMKQVAIEKRIKFRFLISAEHTSKYLDEKQQTEIRNHLPNAISFFRYMENFSYKHFQYRETDQLILDGITCARVLFPGNDKSAHSKGKLIALQDINAAHGEHKASILFACTCNKEDEEGDITCMAHGLYNRTKLIYNKSSNNGEGSQLSIRTILMDRNEGLSSRNNSPSSYLHRIIPYFRCISNQKLDEVPAPLCVQIQLSSSCSTHCEMCDHWKVKKSDLPFGKWKETFLQLADFGVKTIVLSGGEPLVREDIDNLIEYAHQKGLKMGLLTNGNIPSKCKRRLEIIKSIKNYVDWVSISIDGTRDTDKSIRHPAVQGRIKLIEEFCSGLKEGPILSATVTLQKGNITTDLNQTCEFIQKLGILQVNFKLATGAKKALLNDPQYLLTMPELNELVEFLFENPLPDKCGNNLAYLRRCFAGGIFNKKDTTEGSPVRTFYFENQLRCFTPLIFTLIDSDGEVYPCCHLYRDNHGSDRRSNGFRKVHSLGNITESLFSNIWNGSKYVQKRKELAIIDPNSSNYLPCGECTRYCQHNFSLTKIYSEYKDDLEKLENELKAENLIENKPVWF